MPKTTCSIEGCAKPTRARGWCEAHYKRWRRTGDAGHTLPTLDQRFWARVDKSGDCWLWTGAKNLDGYGVISSEGKPSLTHRVAYELQVGPIPRGQQIDHICHATSCVRAEHLRPATSKQNQENRAGAHSNSKSGVRGVCWNKQRRKWQSDVCHNSKTYYVGLFDDIREAEAAVIAKRNELFTHNILDRH
jgi:hypothetical protein